jgi:hypothetical protein
MRDLRIGSNRDSHATAAVRRYGAAIAPTTGCGAAIVQRRDGAA